MSVADRPMPGAPHVAVGRDVPSLAAALAGRVIDTIAFRLKDEWVSMAHVAFTGGELGAALCAALAASPRRREVDWDKVHLWWTDEPYLRAGHSERTDTQARDAGLLDLGIPPRQIHAIGGPPDLDLDAAAADYARQLRMFAPHGRPTPVFDLVLLSVGAAGEVAGLRPGSRGSSAGVTGPPVAVVDDAPADVPKRVSLGLSTIDTATRVWLLATGADRATVVGRALRTGPDTGPQLALELPAAAARGVIETVWWLDRAAARVVSPSLAREEVPDLSLQD